MLVAWLCFAVACGLPTLVSVWFDLRTTLVCVLVSRVRSLALGQWSRRRARAETGGPEAQQLEQLASFSAGLEAVIQLCQRVPAAPTDELPAGAHASVLGGAPGARRWAGR